MPKCLTPAQIEQYREEGCIFPIRIMSETEAAELRGRLEAFGVEVVYGTDQVQFSKGETTRYRHLSDESGCWLDVEFCGRCGSNMGFTLEAVPGVRTLPAGAFGDPSWISADRYKYRHVYLRSRRDWSDLSPAVDQYEQHFRS